MDELPVICHTPRTMTQTPRLIAHLVKDNPKPCRKSELAMSRPLARVPQSSSSVDASPFLPSRHLCHRRLCVEQSRRVCWIIVHRAECELRARYQPAKSSSRLHEHASSHALSHSLSHNFTRRRPCPAG